MTKKSDPRAEIAATVRSSLTLPKLPVPQPRHPAAAGMTREARRDVFNLDPKRIVEEGFYVRETDVDDEAFDSFVQAVAERGQIDHPVSVRTTGPVTARRYILVWGMRRLRAALRLGHEQIPVRDFGEISETEAIKLQLQENLNRKAMSPLETALAFWELAGRGERNAAIARLFAKTPSYVSYMVKTGEALARLTAEERRRLNAPHALRVRDCQDVAVHEDLDARVRALRSLADRLAPAAADDQERADDHAVAPVASPAAAAHGDQARAEDGGGEKHPPPRLRRPDEDAPFLVRELRSGRGRVFRVRWHDRDLMADPEGFATRITTAVRAEIEHLLARLDALRASAPPGAPGRDMAAEFERAREAALRHAAWLAAPRPDHRE